VEQPQLGRPGRPTTSGLTPAPDATVPTEGEQFASDCCIRWRRLRPKWVKETCCDSSDEQGSLTARKSVEAVNERLEPLDELARKRATCLESAPMATASPCNDEYGPLAFLSRARLPTVPRYCDPGFAAIPTTSLMAAIDGATAPGWRDSCGFRLTRKAQGQRTRHPGLTLKMNTKMAEIMLDGRSQAGERSPQLEASLCPPWSATLRLCHSFGASFRHRGSARAVTAQYNWKSCGTQFHPTIDPAFASSAF